MIKLLGVVVGIYILIVIAMTLFQRKLMYYPHTDMQPPENHGLQGFTVESLTTEDGVRLTYWYAVPEKGKPTILYLHGNGGHLGFRTGFYQHAKELGYGVLALSYRGFGTSQGSPSEQGLYADAKAALSALNERYHADDANIIVYGESIGTGVSVELARTHSFKMVALQAPFTSTRHRAEQLYYWLPVRWVMWDVYDSYSKLPELTSPVLVMIGDADRLILPEDSMKLYEAIATPKKLMRFPEITHNNFIPKDTLQAVADFEQQLLKPID